MGPASKCITDGADRLIIMPICHTPLPEREDCGMRVSGCARHPTHVFFSLEVGVVIGRKSGSKQGEVVI